MTLLFDELGFVLDDEQYRDALLMVDLFHFYLRQQQVRCITCLSRYLLKGT